MFLINHRVSGSQVPASRAPPAPMPSLCGCCFVFLPRSPAVQSPAALAITLAVLQLQRAERKCSSCGSGTQGACSPASAGPGASPAQRDNRLPASSRAEFAETALRGTLGGRPVLSVPALAEVSALDRVRWSGLHAGSPARSVQGTLEPALSPHEVTGGAEDAVTASAQGRGQTRPPGCGPLFLAWKTRVSQRKCCTSPCGRGAPRASPHHAPPSATSRGGEDASVFLRSGALATHEEDTHPGKG